MNEIIIDGRTAVPIRLIPFMSARRFSPDVLVEMLQKSTKFNRNYIASYYLLPDKSYQKMYPHDWDVINTDLHDLEKKLASSDNEKAHSVWREESTRIIPGSSFVWFDDLEKANKQYIKNTIFIDERPGYRDLNLQVYLPKEIRALVYEEFSEEFIETTDELVNVHQSVDHPWKITAFDIGREIFMKNPRLSLDQIASKTHIVMKERGILGCRRKVPSASNIKRNAFTGLKS